MAYSEATISDVLAQLAANGGNIAKTARENGVSQRTIRKWRDNVVPGQDVDSVRTKVRQKKDSLADKLEQIAFQVLGGVIDDPEKINFGSFKDRMTGAGIAIDKMRLLRGQGDDAKRGLDEFLDMTDFDDVEETKG